jgi:hypothetical protein
MKLDIESTRRKKRWDMDIKSAQGYIEIANIWGYSENEQWTLFILEYFWKVWNE